MDAPPARGSENLGSLWQSSCRPLRLRRRLSLPNLFLQRARMPWPMNGSAFRSMLSSLSTTAGTQASQGTTAQADSNSPPLKEPTVGVKVIPAAESIPVANPLETGPSSLKRTIWHPRPELCALHVWPLDGSLSYSQNVS